METPFQTATRLLEALEEMLIEENSLVRTMDFVEAVTVRERSGPLVEKICLLANDPAVQRLRPRVELLVARWQQTHHFLDEQLHRLQIEMSRVSDARSRLRRVLPAYLSATVSESRLNTAA
jgi:hypothetical protein